MSIDGMIEYCFMTNHQEEPNNFREVWYESSEQEKWKGEILKEMIRMRERVFKIKNDGTYRE